jgi:hypothetical protein
MNQSYLINQPVYPPTHQKKAKCLALGVFQRTQALAELREDLLQQREVL